MTDDLDRQEAEAHALAERAWYANKRRIDPVATKMLQTFHAHMDADDPDGAFDYLAGVLDAGALPEEH